MTLLSLMHDYPLTSAIVICSLGASVYKTVNAVVTTFSNHFVLNLTITPREPRA